MNHTWRTLVAGSEALQVDRTSEAEHAVHMHTAVHIAHSTLMDIQDTDTDSSSNIASDAACCSFFH